MVTYEKIDEETYLVKMETVHLGRIEYEPSILRGDPPGWWEMMWEAPYGTRTIYATSFEALCRDIENCLADLLLNALRGVVDEG